MGNVCTHSFIHSVINYLFRVSICLPLGIERWTRKKWPTLLELAAYWERKSLITLSYVHVLGLEVGRGVPIQSGRVETAVFFLKLRFEEQLVVMQVNSKGWSSGNEVAVFSG